MKGIIALFVISSIFSPVYTQNFKFNEKDYNLSMYKMVGSLNKFIKNKEHDNKQISKEIMSYSKDSIYVLCVFLGYDERVCSKYVIDELLLTYIKRNNISKIYIEDTDIDKWGIWFRLIMVDRLKRNHTIDMSFNKENKLTSVIL